MVLGTEDLTLGSQLILYPNPTSDIVHIQKPNALEIEQIRVFNALGQLLFEEKFSESIDLASFPVGILFVEMETSEGKMTKTIVKE